MGYHFAKLIWALKVAPKISRDVTDSSGKDITIYTTEIIRDKDGHPLIANESPLHDYGITVVQFSVTGTEYDPTTRAQFAAKKESFLAAEKSKAQREQEVQQRLMTIEKGLREKAEVEAVANKEKATAEIQAQQKVAVAEQEKKEAVVRASREVEIAEQAKKQAETLAAQKLSVTNIEKEQALVKANQELEVARLATESAKQRAEAIITLAKAEQDKIRLGGAISESVRVLAEIAAERDVNVAKALANVAMPQIWINGGSASGGDINSQLLSLGLIKWAGIDMKGSIPSSIAAPK